MIKLTISMIEIVAAVLMHGYIVFMCYSYKDTIYKGIKEPYLKSPVLIVACMILSMIFHPGSKGEYFVTYQMLVSFTMFVEAAALVP